MADSANTNADQEEDLRRTATTAPTEDARRRAERQLRRFAEVKKDQAAANDALVGRLSDPRFVSGFGSNGGEEFLSYMMISETLVAEGGTRWTQWDEGVTANLNRIQNRDGSWSGHHCITGRTFCTAAALLVLLADRAPVPIAAQIRRS